MIYRFADCVLDDRRRELSRSGVLQRIEPQVFDLLEFLIKNRDRIVSRKEIFEAVWRGRIVSDSVLSTRINAVRNALGDTGTAQCLIRTARRRGLRFVGKIENGKVQTEVTDSRARIHRRLLLTSDLPRVVVAPFAIAEGSPDEKFLFEGFYEEIISALCKIDWLLVEPKNFLFLNKGRARQLRGAALELGTSYELHFGGRRCADEARVGLKLVDIERNHLVWLDSSSCDIARIFDDHESIVENMVAKIGAYIYAAESMRIKFKSPRDLGAWECIARALALMNTRKRQHHAAAQMLLKRAVQIQPQCAPAYSLLSFLSTLSVHLGWQSRKAAKNAAFKFARAALALDDEEPWAHLALGYATLQINNSPERAIEILERSLSLKPDIAVAHYFIALASTFLGRPENALKHADEAERLDPFDLLARGNVGTYDNVRATASFVAGRYREGIEFARKAVAQSSLLTPAYRQIVISGALGGELEEARAALKSVRRLAPDIQRWLKESESTWARREEYRRYFEGFRMAGFR